jgi:hypothetical protein
MADRENDDRAVRPLLVFNGTMNGSSNKGNDGDSYAVWRARLVINLRAKRLLSIVTGNDDDDDSNDDEIQPSVQRRQARAAHIMISARHSKSLSAALDPVDKFRRVSRVSTAMAGGYATEVVCRYCSRRWSISLCQLSTLSTGRRR